MVDSSPASSKTPKRAAEVQQEGEDPRSVRRKVPTGSERGATVFEIIVGSGDDMKTFAIHENLLVKHSDHFKAAASGRWSEPESRRVKFEDWSPEVFAIFDHFLYSGKIFSARDNDFNKDTYTDKEWKRLGKAWRLGDMLLSTSFKDAVVDAVILKLDQGIPRKLHLTVYTGGNSQSMARKLAVDIIVWKCPPGYFNKEHFGDTSEDFRWDLLSALGKVKNVGRAEQAPWKAGGCTYHEHVAAELPCYNEMF